MNTISFVNLFSKVRVFLQKHLYFLDSENKISHDLDVRPQLQSSPISRISM